MQIDLRGEEITSERQQSTDLLELAKLAAKSQIFLAPMNETESLQS